MIEKVQAYMNQLHMIEKHDKVVVGVSGGADSVCLLLMLEEIREKIPFSIYVVHVNHKIRVEAKQDENYVRQLCKEKGIPFYLIEEDIVKIADIRHISTEEAGREVRYEAFEKVLEEIGGGKIAVAHNKNDRAETVLFHLFRGTGLRGMNGIAPVRGVVIRPLLCLERKEIEQYLQEKRRTFCIDKSNAEDTYTRNRIRHHILPFAEEKICANAVEHIADTAEFLAETEILLQRITDEVYAKYVREQKEEVFLMEKGVLDLEPILQKYLIMKCFFQLTGNRKDITSKHIAEVTALFKKQVGKQVNLPYAMTAKKEYDTVHIYLGQEKVIEKREEHILLEPEKEYDILGLGKVRMRVFPKGKSEIIPEKTYTKWFDYDRIVESLLLRTRETGDYFTISEQNHRKSLKGYMINEKIPKEERDRLWVLADGSHIIWLIGHRISQHYKVNQNTKRILEVYISGGNHNGRAY